MSIYEGLFLLNSHRANRDWDEVFNHVADVLKKHGAELARHEKWGERKLAFPIGREKRGVYLLTYFKADGEAVNHIYRECEISDIIIRALILAVNEIPTVIQQQPPERSAIVRRGPGGDFRGGRGRRDESAVAATAPAVAENAPAEKQE